MEKFLTEKEIQQLLNIVDSRSYRETMKEKTNELKYFTKLVTVANFLHDGIRLEDINLVTRALEDNLLQKLKDLKDEDGGTLLKDAILNLDDSGDTLYQALLDKSLDFKNEKVHEEMQNEKSLLLTKEEQEELIQAVKDREDEEE